MPVTGFNGYDFVLRECPLVAFNVLADHGHISGEIPQLPDLLDGDRGLVPQILLALDVYEKLLACQFCHGYAVVRLFCFNVHNVVRFGFSLLSSSSARSVVRRASKDRGTVKMLSTEHEKTPVDASVTTILTRSNCGQNRSVFFLEPGFVDRTFPVDVLGTGISEGIFDAFKVGRELAQFCRITPQLHPKLLQS